MVCARVTTRNPVEDDDGADEVRPPSKSQLKRDAHELQELGIELLSTPETAWRKLDLPDALVSTLRQTKRTRARGARNRQMQLIGKLMRGVDPEPIRRYFQQERVDASRAVQAHKALETWRDRLIEEGDPAIDEFIGEHPDADRRRLRDLVRQAQKEGAEGKSPASSRALFRYLRDGA